MNTDYFDSRYGVQIRAYLPLGLYLDRGQEGSSGAGRERGFQIGAKISVFVVLTMQHTNFNGFSTNKFLNSICPSVHQAWPSAGQFEMF